MHFLFISSFPAVVILPPSKTLYLFLVSSPEVRLISVLLAVQVAVIPRACSSRARMLSAWKKRALSTCILPARGGHPLELLGLDGGHGSFLVAAMGRKPGSVLCYNFFFLSCSSTIWKVRIFPENTFSLTRKD